MSRDIIPTEAELMRMPAGERGPRLKTLARHFRERAEAAKAEGVARHVITRQANRLTKVYALAIKFQIEGITDT